MNILRVIKIVITVIFIALLSLYLTMFFTTNSLIRDVRSALLIEVDSYQTAGRAIDVYNNSWVLERGRGVGRVDLTLIRLFTIHNFQRGFIYVYYSCEVYDESGELLTGSRSIITRWEIEKLNGEWEIMKIFERP